MILSINEGGFTMDSLRKKWIDKYRRLAKKNKFCRYLATLLIVCHIILYDILKHQKKYYIKLAQVAGVFMLFCLNTSFTPPVLQNNTATLSITEAGTELVSSEAIEDCATDRVSLDDLIEQNHEVDSLEPASQEAADVSVSFKKDDWRLLLINKQHTIPEDYTFTLGTIKGSMQCDERIISPLTDLFAAAKEDGITLVVCSPYRDLSRQEYLFDRKLKNYMNNGISYMDSYKKASVTVTVPGASEHQIGLALDIISSNYSALDEGFGETDAGVWLKENCSKYGFILRYPKGKEDITGIQYEPWHFRYVGKDAATIIMDQQITLEEFVERLS